MSETKFPKLIVQADPIHAGKHPYHDCRYITTEHRLEMIRDSEDDPVMQFAEGNGDEMIVAEMRDCERQAEFARLLSAAPELLEALITLHDTAVDAYNWIGGARPPISMDQLIVNLREHGALARAVIAKAEGRQS